MINGVKELPEITNIKSNLKYFKTELQNKDSTDSSKLKLFKNSIEIIKIKEETYNLLKKK